MEIVELAKYLNQMSQCEQHYDICSQKVQRAYQNKAEWLIDFFIGQGWSDISNKDLAALRAENQRMREALEDMSKTLAVMSYQIKTTEDTHVDGDTEFAYDWFCDESRHVYNQARAALGKE
jgi:hypothetical protein